MNKPITLKQICELMRKINESGEFEAYFSNGKPIIESRIIYIKEDRNI